MAHQQTFPSSMKIPAILLPLLLFCIAGCAQKDQHNFHMPGKIPIDGRRWYQLTNATGGLEMLFDNNQYQKTNTGYNKLVPHYDAWYPLQDGEQISIDSIMMYCWRGIDASHPATLYAVMPDWSRVLIATFKGARAQTWEGPDSDKPGVFALPHRVAGMRYLVINSWGELPGEIEFYGQYTAAAKAEAIATKSVPLANYFGVNAFEWNFQNGKNPDITDAILLNPISSFTGVRHYLDWGKLESTEGNYTYNPARDGSWNYDAIYQWCNTQHIEVLACLKTIPMWMEETYPKDQRNYENVPARYGKDLADPASYTEQAKMAFQFAARYGSNKAIDASLLKVDAKPRWTADKVNIVQAGLGVIRYLECDNERDKWWKGRVAYQTAREYAANLSAFYDGDKGKLGPGVGVKNADPNMQVVMAGLANPSTGYVMGMVDWCKQHRGYKPDGSVDLPWDVINYHYYANDANATGKDQTTGVAPELTTTAAVAAEFVQFSQRYCGGMPVWVTEAGYDVHQQSVQRATPINNRDALLTQADWTLRTSLLYARNHVARVFYYELYDDNATNPTKYATSGLINADHTRRPAADFMRQAAQFFGAYTYAATISKDPTVDKYTLNDKVMYALVVPDAKGRTALYTLDLGTADTAYLYQPQPGEHMQLTKLKTTNGKVKIVVTETLVFVVGGEAK